VKKGYVLNNVFDIKQCIRASPVANCRYRGPFRLVELLSYRVFKYFRTCSCKSTLKISAGYRIRTHLTKK
jgi:hypothetical protein